MPNTLSDKVCFITGGGSGNGKAAIKALLEEGAKIFSLEFSAENIEATRREIPDDRLVWRQGDVRDEASVRAAFAACIERFGTVDILINNAGLGIPTPDLAETDLATYTTMFDVNATGVFLCNREALKIMKPRKRGHIVTLVSMGGQRPNALAPIYCASKFAARGISMGLAEQVVKDNIRVTEIDPGPVDTNYWGNRPVPREKMLKPEDVANAIRFVVTLPDHVVVREVNFDSMAWLAK